MSTLKIDTITAFVITDDEGNEGVMGFKGSEGWVPMIGANEARITSLLPVAKLISGITERPFRIIQFSTMTDITEEVTSKHEHHEQ